MHSEDSQYRLRTRAQDAPVQWYAKPACAAAPAGKGRFRWTDTYMYYLHTRTHWSGLTMFEKKTQTQYVRPLCIHKGQQKYAFRSRNCAMTEMNESWKLIIRCSRAQAPLCVSRLVLSGRKLLIILFVRTCTCTTCISGRGAITVHSMCTLKLFKFV